MSTDTKRIHRVLLLWLELSQALGRVNSNAACAQAPWNCDDLRVREIWQRLTHPENLLALEQWLCQVADGEWADWARKALGTCRERVRHPDESSPPA